MGLKPKINCKLVELSMKERLAGFQYSSRGMKFMISKMLKMSLIGKTGI